MKDTIDLIEIWMPVKDGGQAVTFPDNKHMKLVAYILNGKALKLEKDWVMEIRQVTKEEAKILTPSLNN